MKRSVLDSVKAVLGVELRSCQIEHEPMTTSGGGPFPALAVQIVHRVGEDWDVHNCTLLKIF